MEMELLAIGIGTSSKHIEDFYRAMPPADS